MKLTLLTVLCLVVAASATYMDDYAQYQKQFKKEVASRSEYTKRAAIFKINVEKIKAHNERFAKGLETYTKGINQFTDMTEQEYLEYVNGLPKMDPSLEQKYPTNQEFVNYLNSRTGVPEEFSWIDSGAVTSVKDQGRCGSCTAFAVAATLDTCFFQGSGTLFDDLSEQYFVDCANGHFFGEWGAFGCAGAWPQAYYDYLENVSGGKIQTEQAYPYEGKDGICRSSETGWYSGSSQVAWNNVWAPSEDSVKAWVSEVGPVVTTIFASNEFNGYSGGVLNAADCCNNIDDPDCSYRNNHAVAIVGYGTDAASGLDYWLVKNSWGTWWGDNGYVKVKRGTGHCGVFGHSASGPVACQ